MAVAPIAISLGGHALIDTHQGASIDAQRARAARIAADLAPVIAAADGALLTFGNGPQVGYALARADRTRATMPPLPLWACGAQTQGETGAVLALAFDRALRQIAASRPVLALLTTVVVSATDAAFTHADKPIGLPLSVEQAQALRAAGIAVEDGASPRRLVASPRPSRVRESAAVVSLVRAGALVIAGGGGGIAVSSGSATAGFEPHDAVVDKDYTSALLADAIGARQWLIVSSVPCVYEHYAGPAQRPRPSLSIDDAKALLAAGAFPPGSMGPKIRAALDFLGRAADRRVLICGVDNLADAIAGHSGTWLAAGSASAASRYPLDVPPSEQTR